MEQPQEQVQEQRIPDIKISDILEDLEKGLSRAEIAQKYNIKAIDIVTIFKNPKLKGKRPKAKPRFKLIDDTEQEQTTNQA